MTYEELASIIQSKPQGPRPFFSAVHLVRFLELVETRYFGRKELVERLKVGEGSVRTITNMLKSRDLIEVARSGARLTEKGAGLIASLRKQFTKGVPVPECKATVDSFNVAIAVRGAGDMTSLGVKQRDAAMIAGSSGASTLVYTSGKLVFPGMHPDLTEWDPGLSETIRGELDPREGDAVVIGSAQDIDSAFIGAIAAAVSLL